MTLTLGPVQRQRNEVILPLITCMASPAIKLFFEPTLNVAETHANCLSFCCYQPNVRART